MAVSTESRQALHELIGLLQEVDQRWASDEWNITSDEDVYGAHRALMHMLEGGLHSHFEADAAHPHFRRIVSPTRKFTGDNGDAIYFDAHVSHDYEYKICGEMAGAVYMSITVEEGTDDGSLGSHTAGVLNNTQFDIDQDGRFELFIGGKPRTRNWLALSDKASAVTTRHYFEERTCVAADADREPVITIKALGANPVAATFSDASVAAGIRRAAQFVRSRTVGMPPMSQAKQPAFVGLVPNQFPAPVLPADLGLAAADAHYSMAPYYLADDEALVMIGQWPTCCFANVCLWNRFQQTFDYRNRQVSLNRSQTVLESDGSFRIVLAHQNPGGNNWIDTEGRNLGLVFWRFMLAEGEIATPQAEVVKFVDL
ncbi:MAG: DUF1214 domain-containing protein [Pseudomonadales bacterium]|nr:DUF1214 domain-containing protein [Pseudomonadales bacterium]